MDNINNSRNRWLKHSEVEAEGAPVTAGGNAENSPTVFVIDDDFGARSLVCNLLNDGGYETEAFESSAPFLGEVRSSRAGCLFLDVRLPGMSGLELQNLLRKRGDTIPIVMMSGYADVEIAVRAMRQGAFDFILKPFGVRVLLESARLAIEKDARDRIKRLRRVEVVSRAVRLTPRERQVMNLVVEGSPNKKVADRLGISCKTVELHRSRVMHKMEASSFAELIHFAHIGKFLKREDMVAGERDQYARNHAATPATVRP